MCVSITAIAASEEAPIQSVCVAVFHCSSSIIHTVPSTQLCAQGTHKLTVYTHFHNACGNNVSNTAVYTDRKHTILASF